LRALICQGFIYLTLNRTYAKLVNYLNTKKYQNIIRYSYGKVLKLDTAVSYGNVWL